MEAHALTLQTFFQYVKVTGAIYDVFGDPPTAGTHNYKVVQDGTTGIWTAYYDGNEFEMASWNTAWSGDQAQYMGEVSPVEVVQMMGDSANRTRFSNIQYKTVGGTWTSFGPPIEKNDIPDYWEIDSKPALGYFDIWDKYP